MWPLKERSMALFLVCVVLSCLVGARGNASYIATNSASVALSAPPEALQRAAEEVWERGLLGVLQPIDTSASHGQGNSDSPNTKVENTATLASPQSTEGALKREVTTGSPGRLKREMPTGPPSPSPSPVQMSSDGINQYPPKFVKKSLANTGGATAITERASSGPVKSSAVYMWTGPKNTPSSSSHLSAATAAAAAAAAAAPVAAAECRAAAATDCCANCAYRYRVSSRRALRYWAICGSSAVSSPAANPCACACT
eukprot:GFYU01017232.1.p1 GENE.GFYU01017232.1~~GFYU01017232.1.p1  ORF type:complete len:256 (-),score=36.70 GFYU01017232.1:41-808(-)